MKYGLVIILLTAMLMLIPTAAAQCGGSEQPTCAPTATNTATFTRTPTLTSTDVPAAPTLGSTSQVLPTSTPLRHPNPEVVEMFLPDFPSFPTMTPYPTFTPGTPTPDFFTTMSPLMTAVNEGFNTTLEPFKLPDGTAVNMEAQIAAYQDQTETLFSYIKGLYLTASSFGVIGGSIAFLILGMVYIILVKLFFFMLPVLGMLIGLVRKVITFILEFVPG